MAKGVVRSASESGAPAVPILGRSSTALAMAMGRRFKMT